MNNETGLTWQEFCLFEEHLLAAQELFIKADKGQQRILLNMADNFIP